ncbi:hypothetical protein V8E53_003593 [Lactarius tabidus]
MRNIGGKCLLPRLGKDKRHPLILPTQLSESAESQEVVIEEIDDELDELEGDDYVLPSELTCFHLKASSTQHPEPSGCSVGRAEYKFEPDPMGPCHCCTGKKLGFSLMLPNEATGKTGRGKLDPKVVTSKHIAFSSMSVLELDSGSSHSPIEAPPLDAPAHCTHTQGTKTPLVPFYIQAPAPSKMSFLPMMVLCRFVVPQQREALPLSSPSHQQQVHTDTMPGRVPGGPLADIIQDIQIRLDTIEEWMHRDATWKCWVEEMLRRTD